MSAPSHSTSWVHSIFRYFMPDKSQSFQTTNDLPKCGICGEKVSTPIILTCGHIFDRHCIKKCLASTPYDTDHSNKTLIKEKERDYQPSIYEFTRCKIKATIFSSNGSYIVSTDAGIFSTMNKVKEKILSQYLTDSKKTKVPIVKNIIIENSFKFYPNKSLGEYQLFPGKEIHLFVCLA